MLSRVAERIYWASRYIERAENTARLVSAYYLLALDLPRGILPGWETLIEITGNAGLFLSGHKKIDERSTIRFLLADPTNPGSIINTLGFARENVRTTREAIPAGAWEQVNELYLFARQKADAGITRRARYSYLTEIIQRCQQITGMLAGSMSHDQAYDLVRIGRNLERADMTSRILSVGAAALPMPNDVDNYRTFEFPLWVRVLKSLSAHEIYRQQVGPRVNGEDVVRFLLQDQKFPRAVARCFQEVGFCLRRLPHHDRPSRGIGKLKRLVCRADVTGLMGDGLYDFIDKLQDQISVSHDHIRQTWFNMGWQE